jgi:hypothetical protein
VASELLFAKADIPLQSIDVGASRAIDPATRTENLFGGTLADVVRTETAATGAFYYWFVMPTTRACNFLYMGKANMLQASGVTAVNVKGNSALDYSTATSVYSNSSFDSQALMGPHGEDFIATFATSTAYKYWFVHFDSPTLASRFPLSKLFLGTYFDPGKGPNTKSWRRLRTGYSQRKAKYEFTFGYAGVSYTDALGFFALASKQRRTDPVIALSNGNDRMLNGKKVVFGRVTDFQSPPVATDYNSVSITIQEQV